MTYTYTTEDIRDCYHGCTHDCVDSHDRANFDAWITEYTRQAKSEAWHEGFEAGWEEHENPGPFVNDIWDAKTPNPYRKQP